MSKTIVDDLRESLRDVVFFVSRLREDIETIEHWQRRSGSGRFRFLADDQATASEETKRDNADARSADSEATKRFSAHLSGFWTAHAAAISLIKVLPPKIIDNLKEFKPLWPRTVQDVVAKLGDVLYWPHGDDDAISQLMNAANKLRSDDTKQRVKLLQEADAELRRAESDDLLTHGDDRTAWSIARSKADWVRVLDQLGVQMSSRTFSRRLADKTYRQHPDAKLNDQMVRLDKASLPEDYVDSMTARGIASK